MKSYITERERERRINGIGNDNCITIIGNASEMLFLMHMSIVYSLFSCMLFKNEAIFLRTSLSKRESFILNKRRI